MKAKQTVYKAALYCRLSQEDSQEGESGSIATQKSLLARYAATNGFVIHDYYCDDGYSGTNFERPQFKRMIADIESGLVNLVLVKDLSRFGREYAQMGLYIEHYFEGKEVRFIAIGENIDTANGTDNMLMPITNVINSIYARDCSKKTKAAHRIRALDGKYLGGHAPFGYIKDPNDRHHLVVDPDAAEVVKEIFKLFSEGIGYVRMTKLFRERGILNPQAYFNQNNPDYYESDYWRKPFDWHATSIRAILKNPVYLGHVVFGRSKLKGFHDKTRVPTAEEDWILVENKHEPLVSQQTWDTVHQLMASKRRENLNEEIQYFAGLVRCADCGSALNVSYDKRRHSYKGFSCWVNKNYGKERCTSHAIGWQTLNRLVLEDINRQAELAQSSSERYVEMLTSLKAEKQQSELAKYRRNLTNAEKRLRELGTILNKLYEDYALGKISTERYTSMSVGYEEEHGKLTAQKGVLVAQVEEGEKVFTDANQFVNLIRQYTQIQSLNAKILNELIDRIVVYEKSVDPEGNKRQWVMIYYKFIGCIQKTSSQ